MTGPQLNTWTLGVPILLAAILLYAMVSGAYHAAKQSFSKPLAMLVAVAIVACILAVLVGALYIAGEIGMALGLGGAK